MTDTPMSTALRRLCADGIEADRVYWLGAGDG